MFAAINHINEFYSGLKSIKRNFPFNCAVIGYDDRVILTSADEYDNGKLTYTLTFELDEYGNILHIFSFEKDGSLRTTVENEVVPVYE